LNVLQTRSWSRGSAKKRLRRGVLLGLACLGLALAGIALALEHKPAWYLPRTPSESELRDGRMEAMRIVDQVGDRLVAGQPFDVELSQVQVNVWLSGLEQIWPEAAQRIPREVRQPFVSFEHASVRSAARLESNGWRAVASCAYQLSLSDDKKRLTARLQSIRCGAVPLPQFVTSSLVKSSAPGVVKRQDAGGSWYEYMEWDNHFVWPNGRRPFRIEEIKLDPGMVRIRVVPL
jgi:hypothetical protein